MLAILKRQLILDNLLTVRRIIALWSDHQELLLLILSLVLDLSRAFIKDLVLIFNADIFDGAFNLTLTILISFRFSLIV